MLHEHGQQGTTGDDLTLMQFPCPKWTLNQAPVWTSGCHGSCLTNMASLVYISHCCSDNISTSRPGPHLTRGPEMGLPPTSGAGWRDEVTAALAWPPEPADSSAAGLRMT